MGIQNRLPVMKGLLICSLGLFSAGLSYASFMGIEEGRGLIAPPVNEAFDEESERYFDQYRYSRASVPSSYSSVDKGLVSPFKSQGQCGSCVAFATTNCVETCYRKITGKFGDYSEQQMVDCGYGKGGFGCNGAYPHAYAKWAGDRGKGLASEKQYPYKNTHPSLTCSSRSPVFNQGARVSGSYYTYGGDEEVMKQLDQSAAMVVVFSLAVTQAVLLIILSLLLVMA